MTNDISNLEYERKKILRLMKSVRNRSHIYSSAVKSLSEHMTHSLRGFGDLVVSFDVIDELSQALTSLIAYILQWW
jgi:hypothetical protein